MAVVAVSPGNGHGSADGNGHGKTKTARAVEAVVAFEAAHRRRPSRPELAVLAGVSESTARDALALTKGAGSESH